MDKKEYDVLKARFLKLIASVPLPLRGEIIAVVDNHTISWNAAYGEIKQDTGKAKAVVKHLKQIKLL